MRRGKPKDPENYDRLEVDGIGVYLKSSVEDIFSKITIKVEKLLFVKSLVATGDRRVPNANNSK